MDVQSTEQKAVSSHRDTALLAAAAAVLVGGMFSFYYFDGQFNTLIRTLILLGSVAVGVSLGYQTVGGKALWSYISGSRAELRKVVWPTRQESVQATLMIAVVVLIMSLLLWGLDSALLWGVEVLTGRGT